MALTGQRTFVGFGFGAIQAGLFLYEAYRSGSFRKLVVAEVLPEVVASIRQASGNFSVNIAHSHRIERETLGPLDPEDPAEPAGRERIAAAVAEASEIATAVPSVDFYVGRGPGSLHRLLAEGLARRARAGGAPCVVYAAENHNRAAEILEEAVLGEVKASERAAVRARTRFLNTVIGKMCGVVSDAAEVRARGLHPLTPRSSRAFLVEPFNRILVSAIAHPPDDPAWAGYHRGITVFEEKEDLLPFEEAKLFGHNALHAAAAYLARLLGRARIAELRERPEILAFLGRTAVEEPGAALIRKHGGVDPLFTAVGFAAYAEDLLERMTNPHLGDTVERVGRDVRRKLGWEDRLIGTIRLCLAQGVRPPRMAFAAAAALATLDKSLADPTRPAAPTLNEIWGPGAAAAEKETVLREVEEGRGRLAAWIRAGHPDPETVLVQKEK